MTQEQESDIELRKWCIDAAIRTQEAVVRALPQAPGTRNNVNIDVVGTAQSLHDFITRTRRDRLKPQPLAEGFTTAGDP